MNNKLRYIGPAMLAFMSLAATAQAQAPNGDLLQPKSIARALILCIVFAAVGMLAALVAVWVFDKATPRIDIQKELLNHNIAVAILTGAVILGVSIIVAASIMG